MIINQWVRYRAYYVECITSKRTRLVPRQLFRHIVAFELRLFSKYFRGAHVNAHQSRPDLGAPSAGWLLAAARRVAARIQGAIDCRCVITGELLWIVETLYRHVARVVVCSCIKDSSRGLSFYAFFTFLVLASSCFSPFPYLFIYFHPISVIYLFHFMLFHICFVSFIQPAIIYVHPFCIFFFALFLSSFFHYLI